MSATVPRVAHVCVCFHVCICQQNGSTLLHPESLEKHCGGWKLRKINNVRLLSVRQNICLMSTNTCLTVRTIRAPVNLGGPSKCFGESSKNSGKPPNISTSPNNLGDPRIFLAHRNQVLVRQRNLSENCVIT